MQKDATRMPCVNQKMEHTNVNVKLVTVEMESTNVKVIYLVCSVVFRLHSLQGTLLA